MAHRNQTWLFAALALGALESACGSDGRSDSDAGVLDAGTDEPDASSSDRVPGWHLAWARGFGSGGHNTAHDTVSAGDATLVTGFADSKFTLGEGEPNETTLDGAYTQMYIARYAADGSLDWAKSTHPGVNGVLTQGIAVDATQDGVSVAGGSFMNYAIFGEGEPNETALGSDDYDHLHANHIYLSKYEPGGSLLWAREGRTLSWDEDPDGCPEGDTCQPWALGVGLFDDGSALVSGNFTAKIVFGEGTPTAQALVSAGDSDCFLARYDADGALEWARSMGSTGLDGCVKVRTAADGTFFVLGHFEGSITLGSGEPNETALTAAGTESAFLARMEGDGSLLWGRDLGIDGRVNHAVGGLETASDGNIVLSGRYMGSMGSGDGEDGGVVETPEGGRGMFVAKYTPDGARLWNRISTTTDGISTAWNLAVLRDGSLVVVGNYGGDATFGVGEANETTLSPLEPHYEDSFIMMCAADGTLEWVLGQGGPRHDMFLTVSPHYDAASDTEWFAVAGDYSNTTTFGTGGGDEITVPAIDDDSENMDAVLLRFDKDANVL